METMYPYAYLGLLVSTLGWFYQKLHEKKTGLSGIGFWVFLGAYLACLWMGEAGLLRKLVVVLLRDTALFLGVVLIGNNLAKKPKLFKVAVCCLAAFISVFYFDILRGSFGGSSQPYRLVRLYETITGRSGGTVTVRDDHRFSVIAVGTAGGITQDNLSSYLVSPKGDPGYVYLDAGTGLPGIKKAYENGAFDEIKIPKKPGMLPELWILKNRVKSYLISHSHMDHLSGLILNSTEDTPKTIVGLIRPINKIRDHVFNGVIWPNFGNEGAAPRLGKYTYTRLRIEEESQIPETALRVTPFALSHAGVVSTAFLVRSGESRLLYFGDTGPDQVENRDNMKRVWENIAPLVKAKKLRGIFLEASYPDPCPEDELYGHLTPSWLMKELGVLAKLTNPDNPRKALDGLPVLVTHVKPSVTKGESAKDQIRKQLKKLNDLNVRFVFPEQGQRIEL